MIWVFTFVCLVTALWWAALIWDARAELVAWWREL